MPAIITKGAFSAQGYGFGASAATGATYIEDVFSTYLYTGNGATQTITNGIDLATSGGLVWVKPRSGYTTASSYGNLLFDTVRGVKKATFSNRTDAQVTSGSEGITSFNSNGFSVNYGTGTNLGYDSNGAWPISSWTFRKQPKFFDVVTYTGDGTNNRSISHSLGSTPGLVIVKCTSATAAWPVWQRTLTGSNYNMYLNTTGASGAQGDFSSDGSVNFTSTTFPVSNGGLANTNGQTYVAYLFAHNAGGFGAAGTDNVISCGSFTDDGVGNVNVTLGWEPQYILVKRTSAAQDWFVFDTMRGASYAFANYLKPNLANAEATFSGTSMVPTATGFTSTGTFSGTYIYMAIRRGPMKTPTDATKVFSPITSSAATSTQLTTGFPVDLQIETYRSGTSSRIFVDRLRGIQSTVTTTLNSPYITSNTTNAEASAGYSNNWNNTGFAMPVGFGTLSTIFLNFSRAPGFFDVVCYTGNGATRNIAHNLGVAPELIITKQRSGTQFWCAMTTSLAVGTFLIPNATDKLENYGFWSSAPTSTTYNVTSEASLNANGSTYVAYLFATCPGVSKVGSYTGTGAAQNIDCGFAASARFIMIKRTDNIGDWYCYDSARGISASNDPYFLINTNAAEVTNTNYVDTYASGFALTSTAPAGLNANGGSYIFLAVA